MSDLNNDILTNIQFIDTSANEVSLFEKIDEPVVPPDHKEKEGTEKIDEPVVPLKQKEKEGTEKEDEDVTDENISAIAKVWKESGLLPENFDDKKVNIDSLKNGVYEHLYIPLKESVESEIAEYKNKLLVEEGIDEETIKIARIYNSGIDPRYMDSLFSLDNLANTPVEENSKLDDNTYIDEETLLENRRRVIRAYKTIKGDTKEEIESALEYIFDNDKDEKEAKLAIEGIKNARLRLINDREIARKNAIAKDKENQDNLITLYKDVINTGSWDVESSKFIKDVFDATEFIQVHQESGKVTRKVPLLTKVFYDKNIRILPINDTKEGLASYIKVLHDVLYGTTNKIEKLKNDDAISELVKGKKVTKHTIVDDEHDDKTIDDINFVEIYR